VKKSAHLTLVNDLETSAIEISDRGLAYGDGLFETLRVVDGKVPLLPYHLKRFSLGVKALKLGNPLSIADQLERYVRIALKDAFKHAHLKSAVIKVIVTRGHGGRGYRPSPEPELNFITQVYEYPDFPSSNYSEGISLQLCQHRLSHQPALSGIKHLNRLDQVLASAELEASGSEEGLMLDYQGNAIEGTKSNILLVENNKLITPNLEQAGVAGTMRQYLIDNAEAIGFEFEEKNVSLEQLKSADGLAVMNSVFGLWPVKEFAGKRYAVHKICGTIQSHLKAQLSY
jgi:4-amino-4-deoxychorismate lyase